jgi:hypothetical protein
VVNPTPTCTPQFGNPQCPPTPPPGQGRRI